MPQLEEWLDLLVAEFAQMGDGERVVVCHSLGCALWYQASARRALARAADRVLLVAPPGPSVLCLPITASFDSGPWQRDVLRASSRTRIRLVGSDADPYSPEGASALVYGQPLDLDAETIVAAGHLRIADGYGAWPGALRWCLDGSARFTAVVKHTS
jgi:predicted alpha/beta hydrolase family esterase